MMTKTQATEWVRALRSGEYKQGKSRLKTTVGGNTYYCCLGVARELFGVKTASQCGLTDHGQLIDPDFIPMGVQHDLSVMNDDGISFSQIADRIEYLNKMGGLT